jgi:hypothetical protein
VSSKKTNLPLISAEDADLFAIVGMLPPNTKFKQPGISKRTTNVTKVNPVAPAPKPEPSSNSAPIPAAHSYVHDFAIVTLL